MKAQEIFDTYNQYIMPTYTKQKVIFVKGKGSYLWDIHGNKYLDFFPGWGVVGLGHSHYKVMSAVRDQVSKLIFIANNYYHPAQARLAKELNFWGFASKVFFCNSGAEANEAAIKFARVFGKGRYEIITFRNSFHGRTLANLSATGQEKYKRGFEPLPEGFKNVEFNDAQAVKNAVSDKTVAIMLELIQGEGGINIAQEKFVTFLRDFCTQRNLLLIIDEVQTGLGRSGKMFCYQHYNITPDIVTLAKALGGGLPIGVMMVRREIADILGPGMHASTFGGGPLVCKSSLAVLKTIQKERLVTNASRMGQYLLDKLERLKEKFSFIKEIRGMGLMVGVEMNIDGTEIVQECFRRRLLINCTQHKILRLMPALNVNKKEIDKAIVILEKVFNKIN
jgi:predicted acetylornithine/succinylornithine family transaminase